MKSKEAFLEALQQGIAVLAESEQQDILEEYAQHIEMKISGGLTEEETIQDFGDIHQLIAEILEAYHVNPSYAAGNEKRANVNAPIGHWFACLGQRIRSGAHKIVQAGSEQVPVEVSLTEGEPAASDVGNIASHPRKKIGGSLGKLLKAAVWFGWNGALLLCALPVIGLGVTALLLLGLIAVWLSQGMPLVGSFLGCVGLLATCVGVLGLGKNLVWHRRRAAVCRGSEDIALQEAALTQTKKEGLDDEEE